MPASSCCLTGPEHYSLDSLHGEDFKNIIHEIYADGEFWFAEQLRWQLSSNIWLKWRHPTIKFRGSVLKTFQVMYNILQKNNNKTFLLSIFSRESDSTITNVCSSVSLSVIKTPQQLEIIILHHSSFIILHSFFIILPSFRYF